MNKYFIVGIYCAKEKTTSVRRPKRRHGSFEGTRRSAVKFVSHPSRFSPKKTVAENRRLAADASTTTPVVEAPLWKLSGAEFGLGRTACHGKLCHNRLPRHRITGKLIATNMSSENLCSWKRRKFAVRRRSQYKPYTDVLWMRSIRSPTSR